MDSNKFKSLQILTGPKPTFPSSKKIKIKYGCDGLEEWNNSLHRNFSKFEMDFK
jgi:hypothetical protein